MKYIHILTAAFLAASTAAFAQTEGEKPNSIFEWGKAKADKMTAGKFDPSYVAAPKNKWMVFVSGNGAYNKYNMNVPIPNLSDMSFENTKTSETYPDLLEFSKYRFRLHQGVQGMSVGIGYGSIRAKYSFSLGSRMASQFHIDALGSRFGGFVDYRHSKSMKGTQFDAYMALYDRITDPFPNPNSTTQQLIDKYTTDITSDRNDYKTLHIQGHYVFNYRHFSYSAARTATRIQKKSAGSPIALIDFYQSTAKFEESLLWNIDERYRTWKASVGGGYAYNYTPNGGKVLLHASVIPTVTLISKSEYNTHMYTAEEYIGRMYELINEEEMPYKTLEEFKQKDPEQYKEYEGYFNSRTKDTEKFIKDADHIVGARSKITLNCTARVSATWNINEHYFIGAYGAYQYSNYANKYDYSIKEHNMSGQVFVGYRF